MDPGPRRDDANRGTLPPKKGPPLPANSIMPRLPGERFGRAQQTVRPERREGFDEGRGQYIHATIVSHFQQIRPAPQQYRDASVAS